MCIYLWFNLLKRGPKGKIIKKERELRSTCRKAIAKFACIIGNYILHLKTVGFVGCGRCWTCKFKLQTRPPASPIMCRKKCEVIIK